jgi:hypothetical protein
MKPRNTALLALVVAAVAAFVWLYEIRGADERALRAETEKRLFPGVEAQQIALIALRTKDGKEARLERVEGAWKLLAPISFPADAGTADGLADTLATLRSEARIDDPAAPAEYGLEAQPKVRFRAGDRELVLRVGSRSPVGGNTYAAAAEDKPVYAVASHRVASLDRSLDDLRDKRPMRFDREAVVEIRERWKGGAVRLVRDEQDPEAWRLAEPLAAPADPRNVSKLLSDLEFLRAVGFDDAPAAAAAKGLAQPDLQIELVMRADGKESTARFLLAPKDGDAKRARGNASESVYKLPVTALDDMPRSVDAWRDKQVARFLEHEARRFELAFHAEGAGESVVVTGRRKDGTWSSEPEPMRPEAAAQLVMELSGLDAAKIAAESLGPKERAALGLEPPRVVARVFGGPEEADDAPLAELQLGVADEARGIAAKRPDRDTVYWLPFERAAQIPTSLEALREKFAPAPEKAEDAAPAQVPEAAPEGDSAPE